jgi:hypothetical protein
MTSSLFVSCAVAPFFGTLATPSGGGIALAGLSRPVSMTCEGGRLNEQWDPFVAFTAGYNLDLNLADTRLVQVGLRRRFQAHPAWSESSSVSSFIVNSTTRKWDLFTTFGASYLNQTAFFLNDFERTSQTDIHSGGVFVGFGADWYVFQKNQSPRGSQWQGALVFSEIRGTLLPLALGNPAFQGVILQLSAGLRYIL